MIGRINLRINENEVFLLKYAAEIEGKTVSEFVRGCVEPQLKRAAEILRSKIEEKKETEKGNSPPDPPIGKRKIKKEKRNTHTLRASAREDFLPADVGEVRDYAASIPDCAADPQAFWDFYASRGWKTDGEDVFDWKALFRVWDRNDREKAKKKRFKTDADIAYHAEESNHKENGYDWLHGNTSNER